MEVDLARLEEQALKAGLLLRLRVNRPLSLWAIRLVVAEYIEPNKVQILGEMKAWAYQGTNGFQLDTMRVHPNASACVGHLVWAASMAWALESTPCKIVREVGSSPIDLPLRMVWGGSGSLMLGDCNEVYRRSLKLWQASC